MITSIDTARYLDVQDKVQIGKYVADGHDVRHLPVAETRQFEWCKCKTEAEIEAELDLFAKAAPTGQGRE